MSWPTRAALGLLVVTLAGCGWLYGWPPTGQAFDEGPVVVLGGGEGDRLALGRETVEGAATARELVLSADAADAWEAAGGSCDDEGVRCVVPDPLTTFGEARTVAALADRHGWDEVTVVTSEHHATRTRVTFSLCVDIPTRVVASSSGESIGPRLRSLIREPLATALSLPGRRHC